MKLFMTIFAYVFLLLAFIVMERLEKIGFIRAWLRPFPVQYLVQPMMRYLCCIIAIDVAIIMAIVGLICLLVAWLW